MRRDVGGKCYAAGDIRRGMGYEERERIMRSVGCWADRWMLTMGYQVFVLLFELKLKFGFGDNYCLCGISEFTIIKLLLNV